MNLWYAMSDISAFGMVNTMWNYALESMRYQTALNSANCIFNPGLNYLLDPQFALWQLQMQNQNNCVWNNNSQANSNYPWNNNFQWNNPIAPVWQQPSSSTNSNSSNNSNNSVEAGKIEQYKKLFQTLKNKKALSNDEITKYNNALKEKEVEKRLEALRAWLKDINKDNIKAAIKDDDEIKKMIIDSGLNNDEIGDTLKKSIDALNTMTKGTDFCVFAGSIKDAPKHELIKALSYWNSNHTGENKNIMKYLANNLPKECDYDTAVKNMVDTLISEANEFKNSKEIKEKREKLESAYKKAFKTAYSADDINYHEKVKKGLNDIADEFEALYAQIRMQQAAEIDAKIKEKYEDFNTAIPELINENMMRNEVKKDLEEEGITAPDADKIEKNDGYKRNTQQTYKTAEERIKALNNKLKECQLDLGNGKKLYRSVGKGENGKHQYFMVIDDKLVKLKGWVDANKKLRSYNDNNVIVNDISNDLKPEHYEEFEDDDIITEDLKAKKEQEAKEAKKQQSKDKLNKWNTNGIVDNKENGTYVFKDGNTEIYLKMNENGDIVKCNSDGNNEQNLTNDELSKINNLSSKKEEEIEKNKKQEEAKKSQQGKVQEIDKQNLNESMKENGITPISVSGYGFKSENNKTVYYRYDTSKGEFVFVKEPDIKNISNQGIATYTDGKKIALREIGVSPKQAGKIVQEKLAYDTTAEEYNIIMKKMNSFSTYTEPEDIVEFLEGYDENSSDFWNCRICAHISSENNFGLTNKEKCLRIIAKQALKLMNELGIDEESDDYLDMKYYATEAGTKDSDGKTKPWRREGTFWSTWSLWSSERTGVANHMDDILKKLIKQYKESNDNENANANGNEQQ